MAQTTTEMCVVGRPNTMYLNLTLFRLPLPRTTIDRPILMGNQSPDDKLKGLARERGRMFGPCRKETRSQNVGVEKSGAFSFGDVTCE